MLNAVSRVRALHVAARPLALTIALLVAACNGAQASPTPSTGPSPTPSTNPSNGPTSSPTSPPAPTATAEPSATPISTGQVGEIDHPTEPTAIVLRMFVGGGFIAPSWRLTQTPTFTLYGDNTVLYRPSVTGQGVRLGGGFEQPPYMLARMTPEQVDALLRFALSDGGLLGARESYFDVGVADAPNTDFTINAGGVNKVVSIAALGFDEVGVPPADRADRARFAILSDLLDSFEEQVAAGNVESSELWHPTRYRVFLQEAFDVQQGAVIDWPWPELSVDDFIPTADGADAADLTAAQVALIATEPTGGSMDILVGDPEVIVYSLNVRPLLPDDPPLS